MLTWELVQLTFVHITAIRHESGYLFRYDLVENQNFFSVWLRVRFLSVVYKGRAADGAAVEWNPAEVKVMLVPFSRVAAQSRNIRFREIWLEDLAAEPAAGPGLWILSGLGAKNRGSSVSNGAAERFFGGGGDVTGLFGMKAFIILSISWLHVLTGLQMTSYSTAAWNRQKMEEVWRASVSRRLCLASTAVCVCVFVRVGDAHMIRCLLTSMSLCQNKLITITGANAEIQKFISSTICIVPLVCVYVCVCSGTPLASLQALKPTRTCYSVMVSFPLVWWIKMPPTLLLSSSSSLCWRFGLWCDSCLKHSSLRSTRLTIIATKTWPAGRGALIELKLSFWIDHCVNFGINTVGSSQGALRLRRAKIWNLSHSSFLCSVSSSLARRRIHFPCSTFLR